MKNKKLVASTKYPGDDEYIIIESEKYPTKKAFKAALRNAGLIVKHISTEEEM